MSDGKVLHIFDVAPFCHAGNVNKYARFERIVDIGSKWTTQITPAGGISLLFNQLYYVCNDDCVFCCDRNPVIKKDMYPGYKGDRSATRTMKIQKAVAEYILEKCGGLVVARSGYEADDLIYTIVKQQHDKYDSIYIYTTDSDLYFLVDDVVSVRASSSRAKNVDLYTYEKITGYKYNCMTMSKIIGGDTSDSVRKLPPELGQKLSDFFYSTENFFPHLGNKEFVLEWVKSLFPEAINQVQTIFPLDVPDVPTEMRPVDPRMVASFGDVMHNAKFRGMMTPGFDVEPYILEMQDKGYYEIKEE